MGVKKKYRIEWFNAFTGESVDEEVIKSNLFGKLNINLPEGIILSGNEEQPILLFQIYPLSEPSFKTPVGAEVDLRAFKNIFKSDPSLKIMDLTKWK